MSEYSVVSVGPSLVDFAFDMTGREPIYDGILRRHGVVPGGWAQIETEAKLDETLFELLGQALPGTLEEILSLQEQRQFDLIAGSTNLGVLVALSGVLRKRSVFVSTVGSAEEKRPDVLSTFFSKSLAELGVTHVFLERKGRCPTGIVLGSNTHREKVLLMHPGVMEDLDVLPSALEKAAVVHVEAYELRKGRIAETLHSMIEDGRYVVAVGLGNQTILRGSLRTQLLSYLKEERISFLTGNEQEFIELFNIQDESLSEETLRLLAKRVSVPHMLVTLGERGVATIDLGRVYFQEAFPVEKIVNTSGAGDTAAGVYIAGVLEEKPIPEVLSETVFYASEVLRLRGSRLLEGRKD